MEIKKVNLPISKYTIKCPYGMTPKGITYHETANDASAKNEISYMQSNNKEVSFHFAVDDVGAIQGLPLDRNAWHAGDGGKGKGNRTTIAIECCYSKSGGERYEKAFDNSLTLIAQLMKLYGFTTKQVYFHKNWSGKNCPHRTLAKGITLTKFRKLVQARYDELYKKIAVGVKVKIKAGATYGGLSSTRGKKVSLWARSRKHTVLEFATHKGVKEARLKEINSWVAISSLTLV